MQAGSSMIQGEGRRCPSRQGWMLLALAAAALAAGCASRKAPAPVTHLLSGEINQNTSVAAASSTDATYTVLPGDTLFSIARRYGLGVEFLAQINQISDPSQLRAGQILQLRSQAPARAIAQPVTELSGVRPITGTSSGAGAQPASTPRASDAKLIAWDWPASGRILLAFSINAKGIDLEGKIGDPVKAAADGTVMYAGNGVRGMGNLILLGHSNGFISAYAHNQTLLVKNGQQVKQGAQIASIGQSDTTSPRLHFEIRRDGTPLNPLAYLPAR